MAWLITKIGMFSVVRKTDDIDTDKLTCRARCRQDIEALKEQYLPNIEILHTPHNDYPFRAQVAKKAMSDALAKIVMDIDYDNFKSAVGETAGLTREHIYSKVWATLLELEGLD